MDDKLRRQEAARKSRRDLEDEFGRGSPVNVNVWPPIGWLGWYTKRGGERWWSCEVIAHDRGAPVVKTATGRYHRRPVGEYEFIDRKPKNVGR